MNDDFDEKLNIRTNFSVTASIEYQKKNLDRILQQTKKDKNRIFFLGLFEEEKKIAKNSITKQTSKCVNQIIQLN